jgi:hypothetical protein
MTPLQAVLLIIAVIVVASIAVALITAQKAGQR